MRYSRHLAALALISASIGCGGDEETGSKFTPAGGTGAVSGTSGGSAGRVQDSGSIIMTTGGAGGSGGAGTGTLGDAKICAALEVGVETVPFNMLIMFDQSSSMTTRLDPAVATTRWEAVTKALIQFLESPEAAPLSIGLSYFEQVDANGVTSCDVAKYTPPEVPIALMAPAQVAALVSSINRHSPTGFTPTAPALKGALDHAKQYAMTHSGKTIVALVTDGIPTQCEPQSSIQIAQDIAGPAFMGMPSIRTFVVAAALELTSLGSISMAGGTGHPVVVTDPTTTAELIKTAFLRLSRTNFACSYKIPSAPDGGKSDPGQVNVVVRSDGQASLNLPRFLLGESCGTSEGWYFDNPAMPQSIALCPTTCNNLFNGELRIAVGCAGPPPM